MALVRLPTPASEGGMFIGLSADGRVVAQVPRTVEIFSIDL
jgi:hypothetical protein